MFVLVFCVSERANSQHGANINHANHMLLFARRWNVRSVSILQAHLYLLLASIMTLRGRSASVSVV